MSLLPSAGLLWPGSHVRPLRCWFRAHMAWAGFQATQRTQRNTQLWSCTHPAARPFSRNPSAKHARLVSWYWISRDQSHLRQFRTAPPTMWPCPGSSQEALHYTGHLVATTNKAWHQKEASTTSEPLPQGSPETQLLWLAPTSTRRLCSKLAIRQHLDPCPLPCAGAIHCSLAETSQTALQRQASASWAVSTTASRECFGHCSTCGGSPTSWSHQSQEERRQTSAYHRWCAGQSLPLRASIDGLSILVPWKEAPELTMKSYDPSGSKIWHSFAHPNFKSPWAPCRPFWTLKLRFEESLLPWHVRKSLHTDTRFAFRGQPDLCRASIGTRPGDAFADVVFGYVWARVSRSFEETLAREKLTELIPYRQSLDFQNPARPDEERRPFLGPCWMDDLLLAVCLSSSTAEGLENKAGTATGILLDLCAQHGMTPNVQKGKSELMLSFKGRGSRKLKEKYYSTAGSRSMPIICENQVVHISVVGELASWCHCASFCAHHCWSQEKIGHWTSGLQHP